MFRKVIFYAVLLLHFQNHASGQSLHTIIPHGSTSSPFGYYEYLPNGYHKDPNNYPLMIYLHGVDEKGNDPSKILVNGPPKLIAQGKNFPFIILSPQNWGGFFNPEMLRSFISYATKNYRVDKSRVYLTGISAGAISIWNYLSLYQDQVAAAVPIAGNGYSALATACQMKNVPIWAFHGELDAQVKPGGTVGIVDAINKCIPSPREQAKYTIYPKVGHDSWTRTYDLSAGYDIYSWMLRHSKKIAKRPASTMPIAKFSSFSKDLVEIVKLPLALKSNSGISVSTSNNIWAVNSTSNENFLYLIDTLGKVKAVKQVIGATNLEWADVTKDNNGNLYIADVGNPRNHRKNLQVYKLPSPSNVDNERISPEKIEFSISDQEKFPPDERHLNFDLQSIVHFNDSLFLFTKNRTDPFDGIIKMYRISAAPGNHIAELRDSIFLGNDIPAQFQITSAAISPNQKNLVLLTHNKIWLFTNFKRSDFLKGKIILINLPLFSEKVAIAFKSDTEVYITDLAFRQIKEGGLYKIDLAHWLN